MRLRELREERSLSVRELAELAGVTAATVHRVENGKATPQPRTRRRLAEALGVEPRDLLRGPETPA